MCEVKNPDAVAVEFTPDELQEIDAASKITVHMWLGIPKPGEPGEKDRPLSGRYGKQEARL